MKNLDATEVKRLNREWRRRTTQRIDLILDSVQTPYNVGSILRTAAALGVEHVRLVGATESPGHAKVNKTSMGTQRHVTWSWFADPIQAASDARTAGLRIIGVELTDRARPLFDLDLGGPVCLAVGHEDRGLSKAMLAECDEIGFIPQTGKVGSLNVAVAASVAIYEARRQGWTRSPELG